MGRSGELALTFESSERVASSAEATGGRELFSPLAHTPSIAFALLQRISRDLSVEKKAKSPADAPVAVWLEICAANHPLPCFAWNCAVKKPQWYLRAYRG